MTFILNGTEHDLDGPTTLNDLLLRHTGSLRGSAVAVDAEVVPRSEWDTTQVADGMHIELITAVQGG